VFNPHLQAPTFVPFPPIPGEDYFPGPLKFPSTPDLHLKGPPNLKGCNKGNEKFGNLFPS